MGKILGAYISGVCRLVIVFLAILPTFNVQINMRYRNLLIMSWRKLNLIIKGDLIGFKRLVVMFDVC